MFLTTSKSSCEKCLVRELLKGIVHALHIWHKFDAILEIPSVAQWLYPRLLVVPATRNPQNARVAPPVRNVGVIYGGSLRPPCGCKIAKK